jgi:tripartite-type tricarboxylate transporter receptor subunit TctC
MPERSALAPNIPTVRETGPELAKFDVSSWFGICLPRNAPAPVVDALNKEIKVFLERKDIKNNVAKMGARTDHGTPQQFRFRAGGNHEVRYYHRGGRASDGGKVSAAVTRRR